MKIQSTVKAESTNELIELPKVEKLRVNMLMSKTMERAIRQLDTKDFKTESEYLKGVADKFKELVTSEYSDLLFYNYKLEKDIEDLKKQIK